MISSEALLGAITKAQEEFIYEKPSQEIFNHLLDALLELTGSEYGFIGEVLQKEGKPYLKTHAITNIAWNDDTRKFYEENAPQGLEFYNLNSLFGQVMVTEKPVISGDPYNDPRRTGLPEGHPHMGCFLGVPFFFNNEINGMVGIANRKEGYNEEIVEALKPFLITCASLIEGFRNVKKRNNSEQRLKESVKKLAESNDELNKFAYVTSHDLKSPLRGISTLVDYITDDLEGIDLPDDVQSNFKMIKERIALVYRLIDDIINYSKAGSQKEINEINLDKFFSEFLKTFDGREKSPIIKIKNEGGEIKCNKAQLYQVCSNLIDNAIKYSDKEIPEVHVSYKITKLKFELIIEDNGPGIPDEFKTKVLELFQTLNDRKKEDSTGIGLSIVNKIVTKNGGTLEILDSSELGGACFKLKLKIKN